MNMRFIILLVVLFVQFGYVREELKQIKHMVNEVVCEALETEAKWEE